MSHVERASARQCVGVPVRARPHELDAISALTCSTKIGSEVSVSMRETKSRAIAMSSWNVRRALVPPDVSL